MPTFRECCNRPKNIRVAIIMGIVVGAILITINHILPVKSWVSIVLTPIVPFLVSLFSGAWNESRKPGSISK